MKSECSEELQFNVILTSNVKLPVCLKMYRPSLYGS